MRQRYISCAVISIVQLGLLIIQVAEANDKFGQHQEVDQEPAEARYKITTSQSAETYKIGNSKTNNISYGDNHWMPTSMTNIVLNVPKVKRLRKSRPPTEEEFAIKRQIMDIYDTVSQELGVSKRLPSFEHLGRVLQALNPKYIATERVRRVAFADSSDARALIPLPDVQPKPLIALELDPNSGLPVGVQLNELEATLRRLIVWDQRYVELLANSPNDNLSGIQLTLKRTILCLSHPAFCDKPLDEPEMGPRLSEDLHPEDAPEPPTAATEAVARANAEAATGRGVAARAKAEALALASARQQRAKPAAKMQPTRLQAQPTAAPPMGSQPLPRHRAAVIPPTLTNQEVEETTAAVAAAAAATAALSAPAPAPVPTAAPHQPLQFNPNSDFRARYSQLGGNHRLPNDINQQQQPSPMQPQLRQQQQPVAKSPFAASAYAQANAQAPKHGFRLFS